MENCRRGARDGVPLAVAAGQCTSSTLMMLPLVLVNLDQALITRQGGFGYTARITSELTPGGLVCTGWNGVPPHP